MRAPPAAAAVCPTCGEPLGMRGACVACLLRLALDAEESGAPELALIFGDFEIERREDGSLWELGHGAMGLTFRALDTVLHRRVALKIIRSPASAGDTGAVRERFLREARAAAALRHPNVAGVFHFGVSPEVDGCYCAMELVEGETLEARVRRDGPLSVPLALEVAIQVSRALHAAAQRHLVHRDLKPGNIMLTAADPSEATIEVKVIDFGLARAATDAAEQVEPGHRGFIGTPAFASPEQFSGGTVDARSDIHALGVTLWFALTGRLPFSGRTVEEIHQQQAGGALRLEQLHAAVVPPALVEVIRTCLAFDPSARPTSARALLNALESCRAGKTTPVHRGKFAWPAVAAALLAAAGAVWFWSSPQTPPVAIPSPVGEVAALLPGKSIAVLPFENLSGVQEDAFFAEGLQDDVSISLGKIRDLTVIARASVSGYRDAAAGGNLREVRRALGVSHVLTGSVRRAAERVVLNVALIDTRDERQLWAERYERTLTDALSLQGELAVEIARALGGTLTPEQTVALSKPTNNPEAYLLYLRAREVESSFHRPKQYEPAIRYYEEAIALDPDFTLARARLSIRLSQDTQGKVPERNARARLEAEEALRLRPDMAEARLALASCLFWIEGDYEGALAELSRAAELSPSLAEVPVIAAYIYKFQGRWRERIAALQRAETLDPLNTNVLRYIARTYRWLRDWPEAIRRQDRLRVLLPTDPAIQLHSWRANDEFRLTGDLAVLKRAAALDADTPGVDRTLVNAWRFEAAMLGREYAAAGDYLSQIPPEHFEGRPHPHEMHQAMLAVAQGDEEAARLLEAVHRQLEVQLAPISHERSVRAGDLRANLALAEAFLGRKEDALRRAREAVEREPWALEKNDSAAVLALVCALSGEEEEALALIQHLLTVPVALQRGAVYNMTLADLKWRWQWGPLRKNERFQQLLAGPEPKTNY